MKKMLMLVTLFSLLANVAYLGAAEEGYYWGELSDVVGNPSPEKVMVLGEEAQARGFYLLATTQYRIRLDERELSIEDEVAILYRDQDGVKEVISAMTGTKEQLGSLVAQMMAELDIAEPLQAPEIKMPPEEPVLPDSMAQEKAAEEEGGGAGGEEAEESSGFSKEEEARAQEKNREQDLLDLLNQTPLSQAGEKMPETFMGTIREILSGERVFGVKAQNEEGLTIFEIPRDLAVLTRMAELKDFNLGDMVSVEYETFEEQEVLAKLVRLSPAS